MPPNHFVGTLAAIGMSMMVHIAKVSIHMLIFSYRWLGHDIFVSTTKQVVSQCVSKSICIPSSAPLKGKDIGAA